MPSSTPVPDDSFLGAYARKGAFTDCYSTEVPGQTTLPEFIEAFYTTPLFKVERWLLAQALNIPSNDSDASKLARKESERFSAWRVEHRSDNEVLLSAGQTRSWLCVSPQSTAEAETTLIFGSAVVPSRQGGKFGLAFHALLRFHRLYSKLLLAAAARRLVSIRKARIGA